jgi:hypothetical protein
MPTVLRVRPYRFYFHSHEPNEPPHIPADRDLRSAKFWLGPAALALNLGFRPAELWKVERLVVRHEALLLEAWNEYFSTQSR